MPALAPVVDSLEKLPEAVRTYYEPKDGKYQLLLDGTLPGFVAVSDLNAEKTRVVEFRDNNIKLTKELTDLKAKFGDLDPAAAKTAIEKLAELEKKGLKDGDLSAVVAPLREQIQGLKTQLDAQAAKEAAATKRANDATLHSDISAAFALAKGEPSALGFIVSRAADVFDVEDGKVKAKPNKYSLDKPAEPITVTEWMTTQMKESAFAFKTSSGSGADPKKPGSGSGDGGNRGGMTVLKNPTAQQLGEHATDIAKGKMRVEYDPVTT